MNYREDRYLLLRLRGSSGELEVVGGYDSLDKALDGLDTQKYDASPADLYWLLNTVSHAIIRKWTVETTIRFVPR